jgi:prevent-host-death family protein
MNKRGKRNRWQFSEARAKLCEVVRKARAVGPQFVTHHDGRTVVFLSIQEYEKRSGKMIRSTGGAP